MSIYKIFIIGIYFFMFILLYVEGDSDCNLVSTVKHQISAKDFKITRYDQKYVWCAAYYCSHFLTVLPLQLLVHEINSPKNNLAIHLEKRSVTFTNKCRHCQKEAPQFEMSDSEDTKNCISCPKIEPSKSIEIHVRLDNPSAFDFGSDDCIWDINFNMSIQEFTCKEGVPANIPVNNRCNVSLISSSHLSCIKPTCSKEVLSKRESESFIHKFIPTNSPDICIWNIYVKPPKKLEIAFSPTIKKYLTIYEESLLNPRWDLGKCVDHTSHMNIEPTSKNIFILYRNNESLSSESFLQVNISKAFCSLPTTIENGEVEFHSFDNGTVAHYTCFENYHLIGDQHINCGNKIAQPPICVNEKEKYMSDGPKSANESIHYAYPNPLQGNHSMSVVPFQEIPSHRPSHKTVLDLSRSSSKGKLVSDEPEITRSNVSLIELDQGTIEATKFPPVYETSSVSPVEGSGQSHSEDEDSFLDMSDTDSGTQEVSPSETSSDEDILKLSNVSSQNKSFTPTWRSSDGDLILFSLSSLEDKMMLFIIIGVGVLLIVIITVISLIVCRNRSIRSGLNRKFDTFQNPIYEKPVVRVPIPSNDSDPSREKLDLGDLSDSTVLD